MSFLTCRPTKINIQRAPDVWITFARLLTLTFRYSLVAQGLESDIVQDLFIRSHSQMVRFVGECYHRPPFTNFVNAHDTRTVVEAYLKRSTPAPKENPLYLEVVIAATPLIFHEALHEHQDTIPPLFNVMLSRLWAELVDEEPTSTFEDEWQAKTAYYAISVLKSIESVI